MRSSIVALLLLPTIALAQRNAIIPDSDPEVERKSFIVAPGFEVNLFAADPLLAKPIQMNWDAQGRLWVATSETYPQILPGQKANDKVIILEDTNNDGTADKTTVFADGLLIPTGIEPGDGGCYVANSTELIHLSASKPGGKADIKKVLLSGFGTEDTHHIIHTFRWGPDGCLYFNQSIYIHSHIETPTGVQRLNAGGIWKYNPRTQDLKVFARGWVNSWGHVFDKYGQSFTTDGAGGEGINHVVPGGYYVTSQGPHAGRILHGLNPGSPKYCGLEIISGRHFPDDWQGNLITNDFRGHRVCRFEIKEDGSTYSSRELPELIKTTHPAFRPIDVKMGPDGALYIADWYNPIIQHGEVDFRDPRRDKTHGRIWRVTAKGRPLVKKPELVNAAIPQLLEKLKEPEDWTRQQAKRMLLEKPKADVVSKALAWSFDQAPRTRLETLWVLHAHGMIPPGEIESVLKNNDAGIQIAAGRLRAENRNLLPEASSKLLGERTSQSNPRVRLHSLRDLATIPSASAAESAMSVLDQPMDPTLDYALWLTMRELEPYWLPAFAKGEINFGNDPKKIAFAISASGSPEAVKPLVRLLDDPKLAKATRQELMLVLARIGGPEEQAFCLAKVGDGSLAAREQMAILKEVESAVRSKRIAAPPKNDIIATLLKNSHRPVAFSAMRLAGLWKLANVRSTIETVAQSDDGPAERLAAVEAIALYGDEPSKVLLTKLAMDAEKTITAQAALIGLIGLDPNKAAPLALKQLTESRDGEASAAIAAAFVARRGGGQVLANALKGKTLPADAAKAALAKLRTSGSNEPALVAALRAAGKLDAVAAYPAEAEIKRLAGEAMAKGDAARGEKIYRRAELQCLKCHAIGGAGGQVGPDMTSLGSSAQPDYIVEALLNPNAKVKEGYNAIRIVTGDGKQHQGIKQREADGKVVLRNAEDKEIAINLNEIEEKADARSLMPDGLTQPLTTQELLDLTKFLSELGKVGRYAPNPTPTLRVWEAVESTGVNGERMRRTRASIAAETDNGLTWISKVAMVDGMLPLDELPKYRVWNNANEQSFIRTAIDVTQPGAVRLAFNDPAGLTMFVNSQPIDLKEKTSITLPVGRSNVVFMIDRGRRTTDVKVELLDEPGSPARAKPVLR